ncbi:MAG: hypothetical protein ACYS5V_16770, partial [Planctomycetota bacterium]
MADYKIVPGRGVICGGSAGGGPTGWFVDRFARKGRYTPGAGQHRWPFNHVTTYGAIFTRNAAGCVPMTWTFTVGQREWTLARIGPRSATHVRELAGDIANGGTMDFYWNIIQDKPHKTLAADVQATARLFARSDLAFAPFVYTPDYPEPELAEAVTAADRLELGKAMTTMEKVLAVKGLAGNVRAKAEDLAAQIEERVYRIFELMGKLSADDPALAGYYGKAWADQLAGHPRQKDMQRLLEGLTRTRRYRKAYDTHVRWMTRAPELFTRQRVTVFILPEQMAEVHRIRDAAPAGSTVRRMAGEFAEGLYFRPIPDAVDAEVNIEKPLESGTPIRCKLFIRRLGLPVKITAEWDTTG